MLLVSVVAVHLSACLLCLTMFSSLVLVGVVCCLLFVLFRWVGGFVYLFTSLFGVVGLCCLAWDGVLQSN